MLFDIVIGAELLSHETQDLLFYPLRLSPREVIEVHPQEHVLPADDAECEPVG